MPTTFDFGFRDALVHFHGGARLHVLVALMLRANVRNRCWPSMRRIAKDTGYALAAVNDAKKWLEEHGAIEVVKYDQRIGDEKTEINHLQNVYQLTGIIKFDGMTYPYLYVGGVPQIETSRIETSENETSRIETEVVKESKLVQDSKSVKKKKKTTSASDDAPSTASNPLSLKGQKSAHTDLSTEGTANATDRPLPGAVGVSPVSGPSLLAVIAYAWNKNEGFAKTILSQVVGTAKAGKRGQFKILPAMSAAEILAYSDWYRRHNPKSQGLPASAEWLSESVTEFRGEPDHSARVEQGAQMLVRLFTPRPASAPVSDQPTLPKEEVADRLKSLTSLLLAPSRALREVQS